MGRAKRVKAGHRTPRQAHQRADRRPHDRDVAEQAAARAARRASDPEWLRALDPLNAVLARALLGAHEAATAILAGGRTAATVRALVEQAFASTRTTTEALLRRTPPAGQPACRAGCAFCCALPVSVQPPEALYMALHLRARLNAGALAALVARLRPRVEARRGWTIEQRRTHQRRCVFLTADGRCGIYDGRPLACRGYTSQSAEACQEDRDPMPVHEGVMYATTGVSYGLVEATAALGLESARYELESAVLRALEVPDATERWLRGERVFAGCEQLRSGDRRV
jgi:Fe-S-cluster containining protein